ncbi:MAG TPA: hypothetical protein VM870_01400, partial [Pyrinomonadaceae bacterium]|nr:hypothetical protein [Pyrinomonadaceae bacterium]
MGFLDDAAKVAGGALDALGVKGGQAAGDSPEKPERGDSIKKADDGSPRGKFGQDPTGSNVPNPLDTAPIEFTHYSLVHADDGKTFPHNKFTPVDGGRGEPPTGRAIMFRDALEREAIMLHGFLSSGKMVLAEYLKNQGMMGAAVEMVGGLLGGGPSKPKPDPAQLDTYMGKVEGAGAALKPAAIEYKPLHQASADLHQMRANLKQFNKSLREYYLEKDEGKGPLGALDKAVGSIPGPAKVLMTVQKIGFSMFDIYLGIYLETQSKTQRLIELASHQMTLDAILSKYEKHALVFPVWSAVVEPPVTEEEVVEEEQGNQGGGFSKSVDLLEPVKKEAKKVTDKVDQIKKDVYDFAGANADPKETPGTEQLTKIFGTLKGGESGKDAGSATEMTITALNAALKSVGGLPSFMTLPIREITNVNVSLLEEVYKRIMALPIADLKTAPITIDILETAGRRHLEKTLVGIPVKLLASVLPAKLGGGKDVGFNDLSAQQLITHQIEEKLGKGG